MQFDSAVENGLLEVRNFFAQSTKNFAKFLPRVFPQNVPRYAYSQVWIILSVESSFSR